MEKLDFKRLGGLIIWGFALLVPQFLFKFLNLNDSDLTYLNWLYTGLMVGGLLIYMALTWRKLNRQDLGLYIGLLLTAPVIVSLILVDRFDISPIWIVVAFVIMLLGSLFYMKSNRDLLDEYQWAAIRWARSWGLLAGLFILLALHLFVSVAPVATEPLRAILVRLAGHNDPFAAGLQVSIVILLTCFLSARVLWWLKHK